MPESLVVVTDRGLHCPVGGFYIDPWQPVDLALITHGHGDHRRRGSQRLVLAAPGVPIAAVRLEESERLTGQPYGEPLQLGHVHISFHPAGHVLGSAQIRIDDSEQVWLVSLSARACSPLSRRLRRFAASIWMTGAATSVIAPPSTAF
jgi:putative mRNA 3-end processing factor